MALNADFNERVVVHSAQLPWNDSPMPGVQRRMLDRVGDEVARATSIVRYAPGSHFSPHVHTGGEEFLVLDGVFQDEHGDFPAGSYIRNPVDSRHTPGSAPGCVIFVKLWQFQADDTRHVRIHTTHQPAVPHRDFAGVSVQPLYEDNIECVVMLNLTTGARYQASVPGGAELLVLDGEALETTDHLVKGSWLRIPAGAQIDLTASQPTRLWLKTGHLIQVEEQLARLKTAS